MKRATVRDLRYNFPKIERMLRSGEEIEITKRNQVIGRVIPVNGKPREYPDFRARLKELFGDRILEPTGAELIAEDRDRY